MSEGGFLKRWSRRKRGGDAASDDAPAETRPAAVPDEAGPAQAPPAKPMATAPEAAKPDDEPVDPAALPPLESLGPSSDYTVFLRKGVPEALRAAALRRAWMTDPAIRDFPSPAVDYAWDFNTPEFALRPSDDVEKMLDQIFPPKAEGAAKTETPAPDAAPREAQAAAREPAAEPKLPQIQASAKVPPAAQAPVAAEAPASRRKHGGALPD